MKNSMNTHPAILFAAALCFVLAGCKDYGVEQIPTDDNIAVNVVTPQTVLGKPAHEILHIISAKLLINHVVLCYSGTDDSLELRGAPAVLDLDLSAHAKILIAGRIPSGTFDRIRFTIYKPGDNEILPDSLFADSTRGNQRYSLVVDGLYHETPFTFRSQETIRMEVILTAPLTVSEKGEVQLTLRMDPYAWFTLGNLYYDPFNQLREINNRIRSSQIEAFRDNDRNGEPD
jgi:hypothetical protein